MGYGTRALELLTKYYQNEIQNLDDTLEEDEKETVNEVRAVGLANEIIKPRGKNELPPLLQSLEERSPEQIHYMGVSYGMTQQLYNYWKKNGFAPVYIRLTSNELTGEHSCVMLKSLSTTPEDTRNWLNSFVEDFKRRFLALLSYDFSTFNAALTLSILDYKMEDNNELGNKSLTVSEMDQYLSKFDLKRLASYSKNLVDYHVILDLLPTLTRFFFLNKMPFNLSYAQAAILLGVGLQHKKIEDVGKDIDLQSNQILALFNKSIRKFVKYFKIIDKQRFISASSLIQPKVEDNMEESEDEANETDKGNVAFEELDEMESEDEDEKKPASKDILDLFEKPIETDERFKTASKKRKQISKDAKEEEPENKKRKDDPKRKEFLKQAISNSEFKISGISEEDLEKGVEESGGKGALASGSVIVGTQKEEQKKEVKKYMMKSEKEIKEIEKKYQNQLFKKGGKKKRDVKH